MRVIHRLRRYHTFSLQLERIPRWRGARRSSSTTPQATSTFQHSKRGQEQEPYEPQLLIAGLPRRQSAACPFGCAKVPGGILNCQTDLDRESPGPRLGLHL